MESQEDSALAILRGQRAAAVTFLEGYYQFQLNAFVISAFARPRTVVDGIAYFQETPGFRDALCTFITKTIDAVEDDDHRCVRRFGSDRLILSFDIDDLPGRGPEAMELRRSSWKAAQMTDATGAVVWDLHTAPFGELAVLTATAPASNDNRFPGQIADPETGYSYNLFRDYDPHIGRYVQSDPIGLLGGMNTYAYATGNPVRHIDPKGLEVAVCCRPADIAYGLTDHCWVRTDMIAAGMGANPNIRPGQEYEGYGMRVQVNDHSKDTPTHCTKMHNVNEQCVNAQLKIGRPIGRFLPPFNQCQSFAYSVVNRCRTGPQIPPSR